MASPRHSPDTGELFVLGLIPATLLPALSGCSGTQGLGEAPAARGFWDPCFSITGWQSNPIPAPTWNFLGAVSPHWHWSRRRSCLGSWKPSKTCLQREMALNCSPGGSTCGQEWNWCGCAFTAFPSGKGLLPTLGLLPVPFCSSPCPIAPPALMDTRLSHETSFNGNALVTPHCSPLIKPQ